jgi:hypothetical protein
MNRPLRTPTAFPADHIDSPGFSLGLFIDEKVARLLSSRVGGDWPMGAAGSMWPTLRAMIRTSHSIPASSQQSSEPVAEVTAPSPIRFDARCRSRTAYSPTAIAFSTYLTARRTAYGSWSKCMVRRCVARRGARGKAEVAAMSHSGDRPRRPSDQCERCTFDRKP